jgi:hypothetical protein
MSLIANLMAYGTPGMVAQEIVGAVANSLTAAGSTQGTALKLAVANNIVTTAAASTGVQLPAMGQGDSVFVANLGANAVLVYPVTGGIINALAANAGFSVAAGKSASFIARDNSGNCVSILSA